MSPVPWIKSMGIFAFATNSKQITINNDGVLCKSWLHKTFVKWTDIKDWGLSYCGQTRFEGNTYYLYFSEHECPMKNDCKKKPVKKDEIEYIFKYQNGLDISSELFQQLIYKS